MVPEIVQSQKELFLFLACPGRALPALAGTTLGITLMHAREVSFEVVGADESFVPSAARHWTTLWLLMTMKMLAVEIIHKIKGNGGDEVARGPTSIRICI